MLPKLTTKNVCKTRADNPKICPDGSHHNKGWYTVTHTLPLNSESANYQGRSTFVFNRLYNGRVWVCQYRLGYCVVRQRNHTIRWNRNSEKVYWHGSRYLQRNHETSYKPMRRPVLAQGALACVHGGAFKERTSD